MLLAVILTAEKQFPYAFGGQFSFPFVDPHADSGARLNKLAASLLPVPSSALHPLVRPVLPLLPSLLKGCNFSFSILPQYLEYLFELPMSVVMC